MKNTKEDLINDLADLKILFDKAPVPKDGRMLYDPRTNKILKGKKVSESTNNG